MTAVRFGEFRLDPARRELWRGDAPVQLPSRVLDCIVYLVAHRDRAVGRDELIAAVWGRADVSDNVLDQTIVRARRALGDVGGERRTIATKPRFGYAWAAPTEVIDTDADAPTLAVDADRLEPAAAAPLEAEASVPGASPPFTNGDSHAATAAEVPAPAQIPGAGKRRASRALIASVSFLVAVAAALAAVFAWRSAPTPEAGARSERALVLPVTIDAATSDVWVRLGVMDLIAARLRAAGLPVVPSDNVVALARDMDLADPATLDRMADTAAASLVIATEAHENNGAWRVSLETVRGPTPPLRASGEGADVVTAARVATDVLAQRLRLPSDIASAPPQDEAVHGLLQQIEAALLADEPATAEALLARFDERQQARVDVRFHAAMIDFRVGELDAAQVGFERLLADAEAAADSRPGGAGDPVFRARIHNGLGNLSMRRGDYTAAERHADAAIALVGDGPPTTELGRALTGRAVARSSDNRFEPALADSVRARIVLESIGDRLALARLDTNVGILDARRDRFAEALPVLEAAAENLAAYHDLTSELYARVALAYTQLALLDPAAALAGEPRLRELIEREPHDGRSRYAALARVEVLAANGQLATAQSLLAQILASAGTDAALDGAALSMAARLAFADDRWAQARELAGDALRYDWSDENPRAYARTWLTLIRAGRRAGVDVAADLAALRDWAGGQANPVVDLYAALAEGVAEAEAVAADTAFERAIAAAEAGRVPLDLLEASAVYGQALIERGEPARAGEIVARTAPWARRHYEAALLQLRLYHALGQPPAWRSALAQALALAGERVIPVALREAPAGPASAIP